MVLERPGPTRGVYGAARLHGAGGNNFRRG